MAAIKVAITLDQSMLRRIDRLVKRAQFPNRSRAIQEAVAEKLSRLEHRRLALELSKLDVSEERSLADTGLAQETKEWPAY